MTLTKLEQRVFDIKERIKLFRLTYQDIFSIKNKEETEQEKLPKSRTLSDIEREQGRHI